MGPSSQVITLTPPLSRKPGEGVPSSRTYKGLFGAEGAENAERILSIVGAVREPPLCVWGPFKRMKSMKKRGGRKAV
jgi:hypothetical protein